MDERRKILIAPTEKEAIRWSVEQFFDLAKKAISKQGVFAVALSGAALLPPKLEAILATAQAKASRLETDRCLLER